MSLADKFCSNFLSCPWSFAARWLLLLLILLAHNLSSSVISSRLTSTMKGFICLIDNGGNPINRPSHCRLLITAKWPRWCINIRQCTPRFNGMYTVIFWVRKNLHRIKRSVVKVSKITSLNYCHTDCRIVPAVVLVHFCIMFTVLCSLFLTE